MLRLTRLARVERRSAIYYGWPMLLGISAAQVTSWGILAYTFSVFLTPMHDDLGWSIAQMTGAYSLALLISGLVAIPVGRWIDHHGPRALMTIGSCVGALLIAAWSGVNNLILFYLLWAGVGVVMASVLYEPAFTIVANWFHRLRGRALTILTFIGGFASVIYIPLSNWLIDNYGWRTALLILAAILAIGTIPIHALMLRRSPAAMGLEPDGGVVQPAPDKAALPEHPGVTLQEALRDRAFWALTLAFVLATFATMAVTIHLIPYLTTEGYNTQFAASAAGLIGLLALPGRLIFTPLGSHIPRQIVTALIFVLQTISLLVLLSFHSTTGVIVFVVLFGAGFGAITPARAALVAESYGRTHYGSINGSLALFVTGSRSLAPVGAGLIYTIFGSYVPVLWLLVALSALAAIAALWSRSTLLETRQQATGNRQ
jgi:MFS family permease